MEESDFYDVDDVQEYSYNPRQGEIFTNYISTLEPIDEVRRQATLPWIRCTCGKLTSRYQNLYNRLLDEKVEDYQDKFMEAQEGLRQKIESNLRYRRISDRQIIVMSDSIAREYADKNFLRKIEENNLARLCCLNTLQNPIKLPLGTFVDPDEDVDAMIGDRMSKLQVEKPDQSRVYRAI